MEAADQGRNYVADGGLYGPSEHGFLADRLLGKLGLDAAAAQKQQAPHHDRQAASITLVWILRLSSTSGR